MRRKKKVVINFNDRVHSVKGILSLSLGLLILIAICTLLIISSKSDGATGLWLGYVGFLLAIFSVVGFIFGVKSYKEKDIYFTAPISGIILNGILVVAFVIVYLFGAIS